ncbi:hypothetical protein DBA29_08900 [Xenophilus aerolatus]|jgi:hypothetical protein|nr:hypothetical protein [Xenophilus aerolatus]PTT34747.1 hypothetical protein DBR23_25290 [Acidovorax sp. HMWF018]TAJ61874.1 MAG: transposase [Variovorax sp.]
MEREHEQKTTPELLTGVQGQGGAGGQPFAGSRMPRHMLKARGFEVGRKHVAPLMRRMGIKALYSKPNTSRSMCDLPVPVARPGDRACEPGLGDGPDLHPDGTRLRVPGRDH